MASRTAFEELEQAANGDGFGLVKRGLLMLCKEAHTLDEEATAAEKARSLGVPAEVLDAQQTAKLDPGIRMDIAGSVFFPKDCHLTPDRFMAAMKKLASDAGVKFFYDTEVTGFSKRGLILEAVKTSRGDFAADEFVLCGGSWSSNLAQTLGLNIPMQAGKGYSLTLPNPPKKPEICAILTEARVAVTPMGKALRIGGTMEIAGLNEDVNPIRVQGIIKSALRYYPELRAEDFDGLEPWRGLRPCSPDGLPYLGRTARYNNLSFATGHAMMGLSLGPITGKLMAEILETRKPSIDISMLKPDRYA
jgi:D-amino-acid dehydrogenase